MANPLGSKDPSDFLKNVGNLDEAMNSNTSQKWLDRPTPDKPATERWTWKGIEDRAQVEIDEAIQAKIDAQSARDDAQAIAETLAAVKIYRTYAFAQADLANLDEGENVEINQDETTDGLRTRYVVVSGALSDKTILSTVVAVSSTPLADTAAWEDIPALTSTPATISNSLNTVAQKLAKRTKKLQNDFASIDPQYFVKQTSAAGVGVLPSGDASDLPAQLPADGWLVRFDEDLGAPVWYDRASSEWKQFGSGAGAMFEIYPHNGPIETIQVGSIPANGQQWFAETYPDAAAGIEAGNQFVVSELLWQTGVSSNPDAYKGCWSSGGTDGQGRRWYRAPKLNRDGSYRAPFLRGSEVDVDAGKIITDQLQKHWHASGDAPDTVPSYRSAAPAGSGNYPAYPLTSLPGISLTSTKYIPDGGGNPRVGDETHPRYHGVIMCIRMFGAVSNPGSLDAAQLATDLGIVDAKVQSLEGAVEAAISTKELLWSGTASSGSVTLSRSLVSGETLAVVFTVSSVQHPSTPALYFASDAAWPAKCAFTGAMPAYIGGTLTISGTSATVAVSSGAITSIYAIKGA